jgi:hypothetical protein
MGGVGLRCYFALNQEEYEGTIPGNRPFVYRIAEDL